MSRGGRQSTPAPTAPLSPANTPISAKVASTSQPEEAADAVASGPLGPVLPACRALLKQLTALEQFIRKNDSRAREEYVKTVGCAKEVETAIALLEGIITKKTLQTALDATASKVIDALGSVVAAQPTTYASAIKAPALPPELDIVIKLPDADVSKFRELDSDTLRARVEDALRSVKDLANIVPQVIRLTAKGNVHLRVRNLTERVLVQRYADSWVNALARNASMRAPTYTVAVSYAPTDFNPTLQSATSLLHSWNKAVIPHPYDIVKIRWLNPKTVSAPGKRASTLLVTLNDPKAASDLIFHSCFVAGKDSRPLPCPTARYIENPAQCYRCQKFGHIAKYCEKQATIAREACARCAGTHPTKACPCTLEKRCAETPCIHLAPVKCANCNGPHKASSGQCPHRKTIYDMHARRPEFSNPYFVTDYAPGGAALA